MSDSPKPISEAHRAFARALVALAREHGASKLVVDFALSSSSRFRAGTQDWTSVKMAWGEERHGSAGRISLHAEAHDSFPEQESSHEQ